MFRWLLVVCVLLAVCLGMFVGILNPEIVKFDLMWIDGELPLGALMLSCFFLGVLVTALLSLLMALIRKARHRAS